MSGRGQKRQTIMAWRSVYGQRFLENSTIGIRRRQVSYPQPVAACPLIRLQLDAAAIAPFWTHSPGRQHWHRYPALDRVAGIRSHSCRPTGTANVHRVETAVSGHRRPLDCCGRFGAVCGQIPRAQSCNHSCRVPSCAPAGRSRPCRRVVDRKNLPCIERPCPISPCR